MALRLFRGDAVLRMVWISGGFMVEKGLYPAYGYPCGACKAFHAHRFDCLTSNGARAAR